MSTGTSTRPAVMTSPSRSVRDWWSPVPGRGVSSMYCSPIAERLCTDAWTSKGTSIPDRIASTARTPVAVTSTDLTWPTSVPR